VDTQHFADDATACSSSAGCSWDEMPNSRQGFDILETASFLNHLSPELFGKYLYLKKLDSVFKRNIYYLVVQKAFSCSHISYSSVFHTLCATTRYQVCHVIFIRKYTVKH
jgi:hypothetical protein